MSDVYELVDRARNVFDDIIELATTRLLTGAKTRTVHDAVASAFDCLETIEAYALLAAPGKSDAERAIRALTRDLIDLQESLRN